MLNIISQLFTKKLNSTIDKLFNNYFNAFLNLIVIQNINNFKA